MAVDNKHPEYAEREAEWKTMSDTLRGAQSVKEEGEGYLPMPSGFREQDDKGVGMYSAYITRGQFPDIVSPTSRGMIGLIHKAEVDIKLPKAMEYLFENATGDGLPLEMLARRITTGIMNKGRHAILADVAEGGGQPYLVGYDAEALINWSTERDFFVLDESGRERNGFDWVDVKRHRVLRLDGGTYTVQVYDNLAEGETFIPQRAARAGAFDTIPLVVIGPTDTELKPETPPLLGVANASLACYRLDADYRYQMYSAGQETLFVFSLDPVKHTPDVVGAGVIVGLPAGEGAHAEYVGPSGNAIAAQRTAIVDERANAVSLGAKLFESDTKGAESGEALKLRFGAQTATLTTIAQTSAFALERALRHIATFLNLDPEEVIVKPNVEFVATVMTPSDAINLVNMWQRSAISYETLYDNLQRGRIASPERTAEEEQALIEEGPDPLENAPKPPTKLVMDPKTGLPLAIQPPANA
jgi:Domain of unknown function (DUF4055)